ncbi:uncharacterized protein LOC144173606 [Haemaphysalis longicornis]
MVAPTPLVGPAVPPMEPSSLSDPAVGGVRRRILQCPYCPFVSRFESAIRRHQLRHTKERPHRCDFCPQSFQRRYQLTQHLLTRHGAKPMPTARLYHLPVPAPPHPHEPSNSHSIHPGASDSSSEGPSLVDMCADLLPF